ncbi:MAG: beta-N-acetylhexosaminidase [Naasia sp.]|nr:beta-N-acetylhexosaminidase [Naasia sp.]
MTAPALIPVPRHLEERSGRVLLRGPDQVARSIDPTLPVEGYVLEIRDDAVVIRGGGPAGVFYAVQTLLQLLPPAAAATAHCSLEAALAAAGPVEVPQLLVEDQPEHAWRGFLLDVARHFQPLEVLLRLVDQLAAHKLNVLHLHLTDDQGWRFPVPGYPRLTEVGGWRRESPVGFDHEGDDLKRDGVRHGGWYTRSDLEHLVAYAAERHIAIVPEVDLPGHATAAIAAYPELGNGAHHGAAGVEVRTRWGISTTILNLEDATLAFVDAVLDEVMDIFPGTWIHGGGDEVPKAEWRGSARVQRRKAELGLDDEEQLQGWFTARLADTVRRRGRRLLAWDEVVAGGAPRDTLVMAWRSAAHGVAAIRAGYDVVMSPSETLYLDHRQSLALGEPVTFPGSPVTLADVHAFEPVPAELRPPAAGDGRVVGGQANLWTEYVPTAEHLEYMAFPRLCAFAEAVWRAPAPADGTRDYAGFLGRLEQHLARLAAAGIRYRPLDGTPGGGG